MLFSLRRCSCDSFALSQFIYLAIITSFAIATSLHAYEPQPGIDNSQGWRPASQVHSDNQQQLGQDSEIRVPEGLDRLLYSLEILHAKFFDLTTGSYPTAIQWTSAFIQTQVSSTLESLLRVSPTDYANASTYIDHFFPQLTAFFVQQPVDDLLRNEANDDLLWVVLGWLSAARFLKLHQQQYGDKYINWVHPFEERAKIFYDAAAKGWNTSLCQGGMFWNPHLPIPYKNAITNELYISASVEMYLYYPGRHTRYLRNAKQGYAWLNDSDMRNGAGLYVDGFHVSNMTKAKCDLRTEQTWTYNQGVVLSGLRGLFQATQHKDYLEDAHKLIRNVVSCEGKIGELVKDGILQESCDSYGICNQDAQMFKGIFMHHLALFCLDTSPRDDLTPSTPSTASCREYSTFIKRNAEAAWISRQASTKIMGGWWSAPDLVHSASEPFSRSAFNDQLKQGQWKPRQAPALEYIESRLTGKLPGVDMIMCSFDAENDLNDRGRGRTVETHTGGLAALRAAWEMEARKG